MAFLRPQHPLRRLAWAGLLGLLWWAAMALLWVWPGETTYELHEFHGLTPRGILHAYTRHDWYMDSSQTPGYEVSRPTFRRDQGFWPTIAVSALVTLTIAWGLLRPPVFIQPRKSGATGRSPLGTAGQCH